MGATLAVATATTQAQCLPTMRYSIALMLAMIPAGERSGIMTEPHTLDGWEAYYTPPPAWGTDEWINEYNNNKGEK